MTFIKTVNRRLKNYRPAISSSSSHHSRQKGRNRNVYICALCKRFHALRFCNKFLKMSTEKRSEVVEDNGYCTNCLARSHDLRACASVDTCRKCNQYHHTLLHPNLQHPNELRRTKSKTMKARHMKNKQHDQPAKRQQQQAKPQILTAKPDIKIIVEAIKSLAQVLSTSEDQSSVA